MVVGPAARSQQKILGGSQKYRKGLTTERGVAPERGVVNWCRAMSEGNFKGL